MGTTIGDTVNQADEGGGREISTGGAPRYTRRLSDKILIAFHHACDQADFEVAEQLLHILEMMLTRRPLTPDGTRRRNMESLVAAHERLWHLRHPHTADDLDQYPASLILPSISESMAPAIREMRRDRETTCREEDTSSRSALTSENSSTR